jgi:hypothetical protein
MKVSIHRDLGVFWFSMDFSPVLKSWRLSVVNTSVRERILQSLAYYEAARIALVSTEVKAVFKLCMAQHSIPRFRHESMTQLSGQGCGISIQSEEYNRCERGICLVRPLWPIYVRAW